MRARPFLELSKEEMEEAFRCLLLAGASGVTPELVELCQETLAMMYFPYTKLWGEEKDKVLVAGLYLKRVAQSKERLDSLNRVMGSFGHKHEYDEPSEQDFLYLIMDALAAGACILNAEDPLEGVHETLRRALQIACDRGTVEAWAAFRDWIRGAVYKEMQENLTAEQEEGDES